MPKIEKDFLKGELVENSISEESVSKEASQITKEKVNLISAPKIVNEKNSTETNYIFVRIM